MDYRTKRDEKTKMCQWIEVFVGDTKYKISVQHEELVINKVDFDDQNLIVKPKYANEISIK